MPLKKALHKCGDNSERDCRVFINQEFKQKHNYRELISFARQEILLADIKHLFDETPGVTLQQYAL